jgi:ribose 5-phosphate isomerase
VAAVVAVAAVAAVTAVAVMAWWQVLGTHWTQGVPVEVVPFAYVPVANKMKALGGRAVLRMAGAAKAG